MDYWSASVVLVAQAVLAAALGLLAPEAWLRRYNLDGPTLVVWGVATGAIGFILAVIGGR